MMDNRGSWALGRKSAGAAVALVVMAVPGAGIAANQPQSILPPAASEPTPAPSPAPSPSPSGTAPASPAPTPAPVAVAPIIEPVMSWTLGDARALLGVIEGIDAEGLYAVDYEPAKLRAAIAAGEGEALDAQASRSFAWLVEDLRDGRTRMDSREQWFVVDSDADTAPTASLLTQALANHNVAEVISGLSPTTPDYSALKALLAVTPKTEKAKRNLIRINMDRWRWLPRELGKYYLLTNVPEFQLRLTVDNSIIRSYRTIVGKVGKTATPQLAANVQGVIFNPTWTVPQSIVVGEGLGARLIGNPASAARQGYKATRNKDGTITVVQQPGAGNSLGFVKLDMPNPHAIFIHDTPSRGLFNQPNRALSHGCVRTERATELGMTMAILGAGKPTEELVQIAQSGKYTKVPMTKTFPIYIMYFTMASDINGNMGTFNDLYGRDAKVLTSFAAPRKIWDGKRKTTEKVIKLDNPL